jgi:hypothetical protein
MYLYASRPNICLQWSSHKDCSAAFGLTFCICWQVSTVVDQMVSINSIQKHQVSLAWINARSFCLILFGDQPPISNWTSFPNFPHAKTYDNRSFCGGGHPRERDFQCSRGRVWLYEGRRLNLNFADTDSYFKPNRIFKSWSFYAYTLEYSLNYLYFSTIFHAEPDRTSSTF